MRKGEETQKSRTGLAPRLEVDGDAREREGEVSRQFSWMQSKQKSVGAGYREDEMNKISKSWANSHWRWNGLSPMSCG